MKAVCIDEPNKVRLEQRDIPVPAPGFARIRVKAAAVCATDLEVIDGNIKAAYPIVPGHEWSGIVDAVGDNEDKQWIGKAVVGSNDVICRRCSACLGGKWRYCKSFKEIGFALDGAYAEYVTVPVYGLCEKAENVPFEQAALCEPVGVALGTMKKAHAQLGDTLLIMGAGSIGLCMLLVGRAIGMRKIVVCASSRKRLRIAEKLGAYATVATSEEDIFEKMREYHPDGTDVVVDAVGKEECISACFKLARKGGTVALAGYGRGKMMSVRIDDIHINNLKVVGAGNNWNMIQKAMSLMEEGIIDVSDFVTNRFRLEDFEQAIELARTRPEGFVKSVFINE